MCQIPFLSNIDIKYITALKYKDLDGTWPSVKGMSVYLFFLIRVFML